MESIVSTLRKIVRGPIKTAIFTEKRKAEKCVLHLTKAEHIFVALKKAIVKDNRITITHKENIHHEN